MPGGMEVENDADVLTVKISWLLKVGSSLTLSQEINL